MLMFAVLNVGAMVRSRLPHGGLFSTPCNTIIKSQVCCEERIPLDTNSSAYHRLHFPNYWLWVASHLRLLHHDSALSRSACIPRRWPRVVRVTIQHAHCDQVRVEHLNLDAQFLQPIPVQKHGVGAHPVTRQHRILLDDVGFGFWFDAFLLSTQ
jgi:hypothetical protein